MVKYRGKFHYPPEVDNNNLGVSKDLEVAKEDNYQRPNSSVAKQCLVVDTSDLNTSLLDLNKKSVIYNTCKVETIDKETEERSVSEFVLL